MLTISTVVTKIRNFIPKLGDEVALGDLYNPKNNAFDFFRFLLASLVIYSHAYPLLYGTSVPERFAKITFGQETFGGLAVAGFFCISGFLVTQSFLHSSSYITYLIKRFLRLFPALIVSSFVTAFVLGPILSGFSLRDYIFGNYGESPFGYFVKNSTMNILGYSYTLRDLFTNNPYPLAVNGSLWTIKHEFVAYIMVMGLGFFSIFKHKKLLLAFTGLSIFLYYANHISGFMLWNLESPRWWAFHTVEYPFLIKLISFFLLGAVLYVLKDNIFFSWKFLLLAIFIFFLSIPLKVYQYVALFTLPYIIISMSIKWKFHKFGQYGDFSYGIYIYAFPIQQTVAYFFSTRIHSAALFAMISFFPTLVLAILSWKYVEEPALKLKAKIQKITTTKKENFVFSRE